MAELKCELLRIDRLTSRGRVDSKTDMDTDDSQRARALHTVVADLDLTVTKHLDGRRLRTGTVHTVQLDGPWETHRRRWTSS